MPCPLPLPASCLARSLRRKRRRPRMKKRALSFPQQTRQGGAAAVAILLLPPRALCVRLVGWAGRDAGGGSLCPALVWPVSIAIGHRLLPTLLLSDRPSHRSSPPHHHTSQPAHQPCLRRAARPPPRRRGRRRRCRSTCTTSRARRRCVGGERERTRTRAHGTADPAAWPGMACSDLGHHHAFIHWLDHSPGWRSTGRTAWTTSRTRTRPSRRSRTPSRR